MVPVTSSSRRAPALWNMLSAAGKSVAVIGWWATFPAEPVRGVVLSDRVSAQLYGKGAESLRRPGLMFPASRAGEFEPELVKDRQISDQEVLRLVHLPPAEIAERRRRDASDDPIVQLVRLLASTARTSTSPAPAARDRPDVMLLYVEGTDTIGHLFASYHPPRSPWIEADLFAAYKDAVVTYYRDLDAASAVARHPAGPHVVVCSDHGFVWGADRPRRWADPYPDRLWWHATGGVRWFPARRPTQRARRRQPPGQSRRPAAAGRIAGRNDMPGSLDWAIEPADAPRFARRQIHRRRRRRGGDQRRESTEFRPAAGLGYLARPAAPGGKFGRRRERHRGGPAAGGGRRCRTRRAAAQPGNLAARRRRRRRRDRAFRDAAAGPEAAAPRSKLAALQPGKRDEALAEYRRAMALAGDRYQREAAFLGASGILAERGSCASPPASWPRVWRFCRPLHPARCVAPCSTSSATSAAPPNPWPAPPRSATTWKTLNALGALYARLGREDEARRLWQRSLSLG
jgi:hypothetical protein